MRLSPEAVLRRFTDILIPGYSSLQLDDETLEIAVGMLDKDPDDETKIRIHQFHEGEQILRKGEPGEIMYLICLGRVGVGRRRFGWGELDYIAYLEAGDVVGEGAVLTGKPRSADVIAKSEIVEAYSLNRDGWL